MRLLSLFIFLLAVCPTDLFSQASDQANFKLEITFDKEIPVSELDLYYFKKAGNMFDEINYSTDSINNQITLFGTNSYVLYVSFPTVRFTHKKRLDNQNSTEVIHSFHFVTTGPLSSYTGEQSKEIKFSYHNSNITASLQFHAIANSHEKMKVQTTGTNSGYENTLSLSNEMIKIRKVED